VENFMPHQLFLPENAADCITHIKPLQFAILIWVRYSEGSLFRKSIISTNSNLTPILTLILTLTLNLTLALYVAHI